MTSSSPSSKAQQSIGPGGLTLRTYTLASGPKVIACDYGAHILSWQNALGEDQLFLSEQAQYQPGKSIRGGIPVIFPQFNAFGKGTRHGFARNTLWHFDPTDANPLRWSLSHYDVCDPHWPFHFQAYLSVMLTNNGLNVELSVNNTGNTPFEFTAALHSYFQVSQLQATRLLGLKGLNYWDNDGSAFSKRSPFAEDILFFDGAIDRVYFDVRAPLHLVDDRRKCTLTHPGFSDIVVWNPGKEDAASMSDLGNNAYQQMLCVEAATIDNPIQLDPEAVWQGAQTITVDPP